MHRLLGEEGKDGNHVTKSLSDKVGQYLNRSYQPGICIFRWESPLSPLSFSVLQFCAGHQFAYNCLNKKDDCSSWEFGTQGTKINSSDQAQIIIDVQFLFYKHSISILYHSMSILYYYRSECFQCQHLRFRNSIFGSGTSVSILI